MNFYKSANLNGVRSQFLVSDANESNLKTSSPIQFNFDRNMGLWDMLKPWIADTKVFSERKMLKRKHNFRLRQ